MTEIEKQALALLNEGSDEWYQSYTETNVHTLFGALCEALERHEAFKREVSDAVTDWKRRCGFTHETRFDRFILPKPDPVLDGLALVVEDVLGTVIGDAEAAKLREALEARGVKVGADVA